MMLREYIRITIPAEEHTDHGVFQFTRRISIGTMCAELEGTNIHIGYSLMHKQDRTNEINRNGFGKNDKNLAVTIAMQKEVFNPFALKNIPRDVQTQWMQFVWRCIRFYKGASTINGVPIV